MSDTIVFEDPSGEGPPVELARMHGQGVFRMKPVIDNHPGQEQPAGIAPSLAQSSPFAGQQGGRCGIIQGRGTLSG